MDYTILHGLNTFVIAHPLLAHTATLLATWIVPVRAPSDDHKVSKSVSS